MSTATLNFYNSFSIEGLIGTVDLDSHSFVCIPLSASYTPSAAHSRVSDLTGEVTTDGGARITLTGVTANQSGGIGKFDADDVTYTQSGANDLVIKYFAIADDTPSGDANKPLLGWGLLDNAGGGTPVTVPAGGSPANSIKIVWHANGIFKTILTNA